ncbi:Glyoxalase-like domain-containing protein [Paenibacillus algorifonticola]|uniref:Glyoxalase-like domain-containing protein n=1 Tax=Paenibacillus algorifonticola TaxID=684063 RepID=A0A1I2GJX4_9BACL|nr:VOC family protein [Paenibacillus algorifonticola]SFF17543.1 Glyoxalase-like domain-containing protein [Paenibacillus algorifonticola]
MSTKGFTHCLQIFPSSDMNKTTAFYELLGFRAVRYLESEEPHICLYRDQIEIVLTKSTKEYIVPNREIHGYGYDAYFITNNQEEMENEFRTLGVKIVRPLSSTDYNNKEFVFEDIDRRWIAVGNKQ